VKLGTSSTSYISSIDKKAALMIIALRDEAVHPFVKALGESKSMVVHTAGALSLNEIAGAGKSYGVLYPLQSLRREIEIIPPLTLLTDGNEPGTREEVNKFAHTIAETVIEADDVTRLKYHLAATIVNNFTNHLFAMAEKFCVDEHISFSALQPLMEETVLRLRHQSPAGSQTGPAIRNDQNTLQKHMDLLKAYPSILKIYEIFTQEIQKMTVNS
jgi:predicted short-subunit dehydrogenase-like oxidoreductase (DUF2520 family)